MSKFGAHVANFTTPITTADTAIAVTANATGERGEVVYLSMTGSGTATAADRQHRALLFSNTDDLGTSVSTAVTPEQFDQASRAALFVCCTAFTTEPATLGTVALVAFGFNQRGGMPWGVPQGEGIKVDANQTESGVAWAVVSDAAGAIDANMHWWEP